MTGGTNRLRLPTCGRQPVSASPTGGRDFQKDAGQKARALYEARRWALSVPKSRRPVLKKPVHRSGTTMGRCRGRATPGILNHDGFFRILYIATGWFRERYQKDLNSFLATGWWPNSPNVARPSHAYEQGWNALTSLFGLTTPGAVRAKASLHEQSEHGTFSDVSELPDWTFGSTAGRLPWAFRPGWPGWKVVLKNRNSPQLRY